MTVVAATINETSLEQAGTCPRLSPQHHLLKKGRVMAASQPILISSLTQLTASIRNTAIAKRFWSKVTKTDACWIWTACLKLQYLVRELREHIAHRRTIRTRPLVEFETVKGRPDRIGSGKRK